MFASPNTLTPAERIRRRLAHRHCTTAGHFLEDVEEFGREEAEAIQSGLERVWLVYDLDTWERRGVPARGKG